MHIYICVALLGYSHLFFVGFVYYYLISSVNNPFHSFYLQDVSIYFFHLNLYKCQHFL